MECEQYRYAISSRLDGEHIGMAPTMLDRHLATCVACRTWEQEAVNLAPAVRVSSADVIPNLTPAILSAIGHERAPVGRLGQLPRWGLAFVALLKLLLDAHQLFTGQVIFHAPRELMSFDIALAVGFLSAAWRPARAYGMLPLVAAAVLLLVTTLGIDPPEGSGGYSGFLSESTHLLQIAGFGLVWVLARTVPRPDRMLDRRRFMRSA